jgi:hypothetical protein
VLYYTAVFILLAVVSSKSNYNLLDYINRFKIIICIVFQAETRFIFRFIITIENGSPWLRQPNFLLQKLRPSLDEYVVYINA